MNKKQIFVLWVLAAWLAFSFLYAARHVEEPGAVGRAVARVARGEELEDRVRYQFQWDRDAGTFFLLAVPGLLVGVPLILTLGRKK